MKRSKISLLVLCLCVTLWAPPAGAAWDEYDDSQSHPLRVLAYLLHPVAFALEWTVFRPLHFLVSATPAQEALFGHTPHPTVLADPEPYDGALLPSSGHSGTATYGTMPGGGPVRTP